MENVFSVLGQSLQEWWRAFLHEVPPFSFRVLEALLLLFIVRILLGRLRHVFARWLGRTRADAHTLFLLDRGLVWFTWATAGIWALSILGFDLTAVAASLGLITLAMTIALQDVFKNVIAGVYLLLERPYQIGQRIKVKDVEGAVEQVRLRVTVLRKPDGSAVFVPNGILFAEIITNRGPETAIPGDATDDVEIGPPNR